MPTFIQISQFVRDWEALGLADEELVELEALIVRRGEAAPIVRNTGGLRKIRFAPSRSGRGKSGGVRVGFALFPALGTVLLMTAYTHATQDNITPAQATFTRRILEQVARDLAKKGKR